MVTKLEKTIFRESSETTDDRNILISLTDDQRIEMKPKGMKTTGVVSIGIKELYDKLNDIAVEKQKEEEILESIAIIKKSKIDEGQPLINLHDFRSKYLISGKIPLSIKVELEAITTLLIKEKLKKE